MNAHVQVDVDALEAELRKSIRGEVRFGDGDRALYSTDSSNYRQIPIGVVIPRDRSDVIATVAACRKFGAPITCRGGGTSLAGQCCNVAVIIDFAKYMNHVLEIDVDSDFIFRRERLGDRLASKNRDVIIEAFLLSHRTMTAFDDRARFEIFGK